MSFKSVFFILTLISSSTLLGQTKRLVKSTEIFALQNRMVSGQTTFEITDSLFSAYLKEPFDVEGYRSTTSMLWALYDRADEMSASCKLCSERKDSVRAVSERESAIEIEKQYQKVIAAGDKYLDSKDYAQALKYYTRASNLKPSDAYPKAKIEEITQQLSFNESNEATKEMTEEEQHFHNCVLLGDYLFNAKQYSSAQDYYLLALQIKPDDPYVTKKVAENDAMLQQQKHE